MGDPYPSGIGIEVKVTDRCDRGCFYCANDDGPAPGADLDPGLLTDRLEQWSRDRDRCAWHIREVRMTGGEPLLNLSAVLAIAETCDRLGVPSGINTNGFLLDERAAEALNAVGLKVVKISFDAADDEMLRRIQKPDASHEELLRGIRNAVAWGFRVLLRLTLCSHNVEQLVECYRLARKLGVEKLQVKPLIRAGRAASSRAFLPRSRITAALRDLAGAVEGTAALPEILCWPPEEAFGLPAKVCGSLDKIYVATNGEVSICNYLPAAPPVGCLAEDSLENILSKRHPPLWRLKEGHVMLAACPQIACFDAAPGPKPSWPQRGAP